MICTLSEFSIFPRLPYDTTLHFTYHPYTYETETVVCVDTIISRSTAMATTPPPQHGINDGSGSKSLKHSYSTDDVNGKPISRDVSLTDILISKGVQELNLISAIVALGEGKPKE